MKEHNDQAQHTPETPHPLAVKKTELIWEGKYDRVGRRVAPLRVPLPFQTVETVNETAQERQKSFLFESPAAYHAKECRRAKPLKVEAGDEC
ncbi:MAG: hypothetical protein L0Y58_19390 [Verrucomicrobia subdivision 3 bacterium]|nr:hypothetical protein [Limisphaerales bacterium]